MWDDREPGSPGVLQLSAYAASIMVTDAPEGSDESLVSDPENFEASLTAHVHSAERLTCPDTGKDYWHMAVMCRGMEIDLLAAYEDLSELPHPGQLVKAVCGMTAATESGITD